MARIRLTDPRRAASRSRMAVEDGIDGSIPYPGSVNQPDRKDKRHDQYDNYDDKPDMPDLRHEWQNDSRDEIGFGIPEAGGPTVASVRVAASKAVRAAVLLLGEKVDDDVIEAQARDFMAMSPESLDRTLQRFADSQSLYSADEDAEDDDKEDEAEDKKEASSKKAEGDEDKDEDKADDEAEDKKEASSKKKAQDEDEDDDKEDKAEDKKEASSKKRAEDKKELPDFIKEKIEEKKEKEDKAEDKKEASSKKKAQDEKDEDDDEAEDKAEDKKEASSKKKAQDEKDEDDEAEEKKEASTKRRAGPNEMDIELTSASGMDISDDAESDPRLAAIWDDAPVLKASEDVQPKKRTPKAGIKELGGQPRAMTAGQGDADDISGIWDSAPDVSSIFR